MCKTSPIVSKVELIVKDRENCTCIQLGWNGNGVMSLRKMSGTLQFKTCTFHLQIGKSKLETMCKTSPTVSKLELIVKDPENCKSRRWRSSRTWLEYKNKRKYKIQGDQSDPQGRSVELQWMYPYTSEHRAPRDMYLEDAGRRNVLVLEIDTSMAGMPKEKVYPHWMYP